MANDFRQQNKKISDFFAKNLAQHGPNSNLSVVWSSKENQLIRFQTLSEIGNLDNTSILDVGSGLNDLYFYLKNTKNKNIRYTGIEISQNHCIEAKKKYPEIEIINADFLYHNFDKTYDYVIASGSFNIEMPDHDSYLKTVINKMYQLANLGVAFNLPSSYSYLVQENYQFESGIKIKYVDPTMIFNYCKSFTPYVTLRHDYLIHDFTIYMYKTPQK